ncbi:hypothetical protein ABFU82_22370 [Nocardioides sp. WV_118_6]|uniref:hypothetical protein n=1 Tax=Pimelobacter TaxID=2044 RepID=UPI001C03D70E|nr:MULTISPECIES: hypothetical protein [Pimelobacter]UUW91417.1 hypothetical protein M0M43_07995 [Pimelobacter simplex]UUW95245.1 hypothetical protein M0M48_26500 [Pimelobacter simplex]
MSLDLPLLAGTLSTAMFVTAALPMVVKAARTKDMASYSAGNLVLSNSGNALYAVYVFTTPPGPLWALHAFNTAVGLLMLAGWLRYAAPARARWPIMAGTSGASGASGRGVR